MKISRPKFKLPDVKFPWPKKKHKVEPKPEDIVRPKEDKKDKKEKKKEDPEIARLNKELVLWRLVAASCAFAALSALLLLG